MTQSTMMTQYLNQFAAETPSGVATIGFSGQALVVQLITFLLAYFLLRKYAFGPILKVLNERREVIENGVKLGEDMQKERAVLDKKVNETLNTARRQADDIVSSANNVARDTQRAAEEKARVKAENILEDAQMRAEQEVVQMRKQLKQEIVVLVSEATEAIIDEKVDATKDAKLIDRALNMQSSGRSA